MKAGSDNGRGTTSSESGAASMQAVVRHYDDLDPFYRAIWGEHVHHGLWLRGDESPEQAAVGLCRFVAEAANIRRGEQVCDVGCGYGATACHLASEHGAHVHAITVSGVQYRYASAVALSSSGCAGTLNYVWGDWLENPFESAAFDAVIAIESTEHMEDQSRCLSEMLRVLKPGGRAVICAWLRSDRPKAWQVRHLLDPICRQGRLFGMGSEVEYQAALALAGFRVVATHNFSKQVRRTWTVCIRRALAGLFTSRDLRKLYFERLGENRIFAVTVVRILVAYLVGAMRYVVFTAERPGGG